MTESITVSASVAKVTTLADMGLRITFDLPEDAIVEAAWLMQAKRQGQVLRLQISAEGVPDAA
jgi:hypothetical protein